MYSCLHRQNAKEEVARLQRVIDERDKEVQRLRDVVAKVEAECTALRREGDAVKSLFTRASSFVDGESSDSDDASMPGGGGTGHMPVSFVLRALQRVFRERSPPCLTAGGGFSAPRPLASVDVVVPAKW